MNDTERFARLDPEQRREIVHRLIQTAQFGTSLVIQVMQAATADEITMVIEGAETNAKTWTVLAEQLRQLYS